MTGRNIAGFAYLSLVGTAAAFILWFNGIRRLPATSPPLLGLAAPVTGAVLGWVVLGQSLSALQLAGFVTTIGAIAYGARLGASVAPDHDTLEVRVVVPGDAPNRSGDTLAGCRPLVLDMC